MQYILLDHSSVFKMHGFISNFVLFCIIFISGVIVGKLWHDVINNCEMTEGLSYLIKIVVKEFNGKLSGNIVQYESEENMMLKIW